MEKAIHDRLIASTREVFETMSFIEAVQMAPIEEHTEIADVDISAVVCLAGSISRA